MLIAKQLAPYLPHAGYPSARCVVVPIRSVRLLAAPQTSMANVELIDRLLCVLLLGWVRTWSQSTCVLERVNMEQRPGGQTVSYYALLAVRPPVWLVPRAPVSTYADIPVRPSRRACGHVDHFVFVEQEGSFGAILSGS
jgi:hypothetical protein